MFHSAFHLYFGVFDLILYAVAFLVSMSVSRAICDDMDAAALQPVPVIAAAALAPAMAPPVTGKSKRVATRPAMMTSTVSVVRDEPVSTQGHDADDDEKPVLSLSDIKQYKLHGKSVVKVDDVPFQVPKSIKRYKLRGQTVVNLKDLERLEEVKT